MLSRASVRLPRASLQVRQSLRNLLPLGMPMPLYGQLGQSACPLSSCRGLGVDDPAPAARPKRAWSTYNQFVHDHYSDADVQAAKVRDRLKIIGSMWQEHKNNRNS